MGGGLRPVTATARSCPVWPWRLTEAIKGSCWSLGTARGRKQGQTVGTWDSSLGKP